jgi:hypothetical protein
MNAIKKITFSLFSCMIFLSMPMLGRWGGGAGFATGLVVGTAVTAPAIAAANADRRYYDDRYYYERDREERHRDAREENRRLREENERLKRENAQQ